VIRVLKFLKTFFLLIKLKTPDKRLSKKQQTLKRYFQITDWNKELGLAAMFKPG
jgi:hypothetical protein